MTTQKLKSLAVVMTLAASALAAPPPIAHRQSPEFTITESSGKTTLLSSFKGKVVVIEFLFIKSPHCLRVAEMLNRLHTELGPLVFSRSPSPSPLLAPWSTVPRWVPWRTTSSSTIPLVIPPLTKWIATSAARATRS